MRPAAAVDGCACRPNSNNSGGVSDDKAMGCVSCHGTATGQLYHRTTEGFS